MFNPDGAIGQGLRRWLRATVYRVPRECETCPACDSGRLSDLDLRTFKESGERRLGFISGCADCGLVFVNPLPSDEEQVKFYSPSGVWALERSGYERQRPAPASKQHGKASWSRMFDEIRQDLEVTSPPAGSRVLDFGCGNGKFLDVLQDCGWETFGIDTAVDYAFPRHQRLTAIPTEPMFDLIIISHVLEHVTRPLALLRDLAAAARPNAFLFVGVPSLQDLPSHRDFSYVINGHNHVTAYTQRCLESLLSKSGWMSLGRPAETRPGKFRLLGRRAATNVPLPASPLDEARRLFDEYYAQTPDAPRNRLAPLRWTARQTIAEWRRRKRRKGTSSAARVNSA